MNPYYLAIDIGASSGRHILGSVQNGKLVLEEIYRFENNIKKENGVLVWDIEALVSQVKEGIKECKRIGKIPVSVAIDTWGVDYVLLDRELREILPAVSYRDARTQAVQEEVESLIPGKELYQKTGIQKQFFNTIYQLYCDQKSGKLKNASHFLMIPEYISFRLTGKVLREYTNATTTGMICAESKTWDFSLVERLGLPSHLFEPLSQPCDSVGAFSDAVREEIGFDSTVVLCPSHDTASAVAACPLEDDSIYVSSGTWSLIGTENTAPVLSDAAREANFTNEGGIEYRFRFLKNIMGMWLFQNIRKELGKKLSYDEMMQKAMASSYRETFDPSAQELVAPESMIEAIRSCLHQPDLPLEDVLSSVYHSLALSYRHAVCQIEEICHKKIGSVFIVGGGSRDRYLNALTAQYTGKRVCIGLTEATATGNLMAQVMRDQQITLAQAREMIRKTFEIKEVK